MALPELTYIGGYLSVWVGTRSVKHGETIEVSPSLGSELLLAVGNWEPANLEAEELVPFMPERVVPFLGFQGTWDTLTTYSSGVVVEEGGGSYLCLSPNTGKKPSSHAELWQPIAKEGPTGPEGHEPEVTGSWVTVTLASGVVQAAGVQTVRVRKELAAAAARLRGSVKLEETIAAETAILTVPAGYRPATKAVLVTVVNEASPVTLEISTAGVLSCVATLSNGSYVRLDGLTWNLT